LAKLVDALTTEHQAAQLAAQGAAAWSHPFTGHTVETRGAR